MSSLFSSRVSRVHILMGISSCFLFLRSWRKCVEPWATQLPTTASCCCSAPWGRFSAVAWSPRTSSAACPPTAEKRAAASRRPCGKKESLRCERRPSLHLTELVLIVAWPLQGVCVGIHPLQETHCGGNKRTCSGFGGLHPAPMWRGVGQWESLVPNSMRSPPPHPLWMLLLHLPPDPGRSTGGSQHWRVHSTLSSWTIPVTTWLPGPSLPESNIWIACHIEIPLLSRPTRWCSVEENSRHKKRAVEGWCHRSSGRPHLTKKWCCVWRKWRPAMQW